nr:hypothetical protein [Mesorhizobium sp. L2C054A000]
MIGLVENQATGFQMGVPQALERWKCLLPASHYPGLERALQYKNAGVVARMQRELAYSLTEAGLLFDDLKLYLWLASQEGVIAPTPQIDKAWHVFLLFTRDYAEFCHSSCGRSVHHRPRIDGDLDDGGLPVRRTVEAVTQYFGPVESLGKNWMFPSLNAKDREGDCSSDSVSCTPTQSCSGDPDPT